MRKKSPFFNKSSTQWEIRKPGCKQLFGGADNSAVLGRLRGEVERNNDLGRELSVENLQCLHAEQALLHRERELLQETEEGMCLRLVF